MRRGLWKNNFIDILAVQMSTAQGEKLEQPKMVQLLKIQSFVLYIAKIKINKLLKIYFLTLLNTTIIILNF